MSIPQIDIADLHAAIKSALTAEFPGVTVEYFDRPGEKIAVPAIRFGLEQIIPAEPMDSGTEQLETELLFSAHCLATYKQGGKLAVRILAANVARFVNDNRFGLPVTPGRFVSANPEEFTDEYEAWRVDFRLGANLGVSIWDPAGVVPEEVFIGQEPRTGTDFILDYVKP